MKATAEDTASTMIAMDILLSFLLLLTTAGEGDGLRDGRAEGRKEEL